VSWENVVFAKVTSAIKIFFGAAANSDGEPVLEGNIKIELTGSRSRSADRTVVAHSDVVIGIVIRRRRAVMLRHVGEPGTMWTFPGGQVNEGETREEAVVRELREAIGLRCKVISTVGERIHPVSGGVITYFLCKAEGGKPRHLEHNKADDIRWLTSKEIEAVTNGTLYDKAQKIIEQTTKFA
jgi:8-oxo-dGTP diphosphatase